MNQKRIQLTLFIPEKDSGEIDRIREAFNPEQYKLIQSHVTLCREDELGNLEKVMLNLERLNFDPVVIHFGPPIRFSDGKGVLIPATGANESFHRLREKVLDGIVEKPRLHEPHITLMHPRNARCTDEIFEQIKKRSCPAEITFRKITLIEQVLGREWMVLNEYK